MISAQSDARELACSVAGEVAIIASEGGVEESSLRIGIYRSATEPDNASELPNLRVLAGRLSWDTQIQEYIEDASQDAAKGSAFAQLISDARCKRLDVIVVGGLRDLGISFDDLLNNVTALDTCGVRWLITSSGIDTDSPPPLGKLVIHLLTDFVRFEEDMIRRRIRVGVAAARREGRRGGRMPRDFPRNVAAQLRTAGKSLRAIGRELGVPPSTVRDALARLPKAS